MGNQAIILYYFTSINQIAYAWQGIVLTNQTFDEELAFDADSIQSLIDDSRVSRVYSSNMTQVVRMQGLGNRFVVIRGPFKLDANKIINLCSSEVDGGADGVLIVTPINSFHVNMQYWNADGSEAEMCGNGLRCVARFAVDNGLVKPGEFIVKTKVGNLKAIWDGIDPNTIEVQVGRVKIVTAPTALENLQFYYVDVGNPHIVTFVDNVDKTPVTTLGPVLEVKPNFPNRTNVEFVEVLSLGKIKMRVWERGVGETQACGTGMVACARLSHEIMKTELPVIVQVPGGEAKVWLDNQGYCRILGPAEYL